jgi:hypothetical protein
VVGVCWSDGNRDRTFWITDPLADANEQQANGVRMVCFIKGHVKMSQITKTWFLPLLEKDYQDPETWG